MNSILLTGRLVKDPEIRYQANGDGRVVNITLAVDRQMSKEKREEAEILGKQTVDFIYVVAWNALADLIKTYTKKGDKIGVEGRLQVTRYADNTGETRYSSSVLAHKIEFLGNYRKESIQEEQDTGSCQEEYENEDFNYQEYDSSDIRRPY